MPATLIMRADANSQIGTGHVMRSLALAQAWQDRGGEVHFVANELPDGTVKVLAANSISVAWTQAERGSSEDAAELLRICEQRSAAWVCVDGYQFGAEYQRIIKQALRRLLFIDDNGHASHYAADLVLNQNVHAREEWYTTRDSQSRLLMGTQYALLRRDFRQPRKSTRAISANVHNLLVTFGGSDPANVTPKAIAAIEGLNKQQSVAAKILVGAGNPRREEITKQVHASTCAQVLEATDDMPALIAWADLAISAAGSTCWEFCALGLPSILLITAENQELLAQELGHIGAAVNLGWQETITPEILRASILKLSHDRHLREQMSRAAGTLVDGFGAVRVVDAMLEAF